MQNSFLHHPSFLGFFVQLLFDLLDPQKSTKTYIGSIRSAYTQYVLQATSQISTSLGLLSGCLSFTK